VSDRIDAAVDAVEAAGCDSLCDSARLNTNTEELGCGDHAELASGNAGDARIPPGLVDFLPHWGS
jgi:hypothetical protein